MKALIHLALVCCAVLLSLGMAESGESRISEALQGLPTTPEMEAAQQVVSDALVKIESEFNSVTNALRALAPAAVARWDAGANFPIRVEQKIDHVYGIPTGPKGGEPTRVREVRGPASDGFSIRIRFGAGQYNETAFRSLEPTFKMPDREMKQGFFTDHVRAEFPEHGIYMVADVQYGTDMDTNTVSKVYDLLKTRIASALESSGSGNSGD